MGNSTPDLRSFGIAVTATVFMAALPAGAQVAPASSAAPTATAAPAQSGSAANADPTVTIFAKKKAVSRKVVTQISATNGSSCSFMGSVNADTGAIQDTSGPEEMLESYMEDLGYGPDSMALEGLPVLGVGLGTIDPNVNSGVRPRVNSTAPFGDAAGTSETKSTNNGVCSGADGAVAAGRDYINSHDTVLKAAYAAYDAKDYPKALGLFEKAYNKVSGYEEAAVILGQMYFDGVGTAKNIDKSLFWFRKAAEANPLPEKAKLAFDPASPNKMDARVEASMSLAQIYMRGIQVPRKPAEARKWLLRADAHGYIPATHLIGRAYQSGYGGEKNLPKAISYFGKAGEAGYAPSQYQMGQFYYFGAEGLPVDKTRAGAWLLLAAKSGYPDALYAVARMYQLGEGGATANQATALQYYKEAALKGQVDAQAMLGVYFYTGEGGAPRDLEVARKLFEQAAKQADPEAMFNLGVMMVNGEGGPKDLVRAYCWFSIAEKGGVEKAGAAQKELSAKMTPEERAQAEALLAPKPVKQ